MKINLLKKCVAALLIVSGLITVSGYAQSNGLTFVTHGWTDNASGWVTDMSNAIQSQASSSWQAKAYNWYFTSANSSPLPGNNGSNTPGAWADLLGGLFGQPAGALQALENGRVLGKYQADQLDLSQYNNIHFIAHSAGTGLVAAFAKELRERGYDGIIQITYLDAYTPSGRTGSDVDYLTKTNTGANIIEHYYSVDSTTEPLVYVTSASIPGANYNRNITSLDDTGIFASGHNWPYIYYQRTINNSSYDGGYGFPLSLEKSAFADMAVSVSGTTNLTMIPAASGVMSGPFRWYSGTLSGQLENYSAQFVITGSASRSAPVVRDGVLLNFSTVTQAPNTDLQLASNSSYVFNGTASAVWEIERTAQITGTGYFGNYNGGVVLKTGAGEAVIGRGVELYNNSGTVKVNAGALTVSGSGENHNGTFTVENSARLNIGGRYELHGANRVTGSGTVSVSGGLVSGAAGDSLNVTGVLMIENSGTLRTTTLSVGSAGKVGVRGSVAANNITADGDFTINSGGVLNVGGLGGGFGVTTLTGALTLSSGALLAFDLGANGLCDRLNLSDGTLLNLSGQSFSDFQFNPLTDIFATEGTYTYDLITGAADSLSGLSELTGQINGYEAALRFNELYSILQLQISVIPEPSAILLLIAGLVALTLTVTIRRHIASHRGTKNMEL